MDYRALYDGEYWGSWDLEGGDKTVTITKCVGGSLVGQGGRKSKKPVIYVEGSEKGICLNKTNGKTIAAMYGTHVEKWAGKKITLYRSMTRSPDGGEDVQCIRVRASAPTVGKGAEPDTDADDGIVKNYITPEQVEELERLADDAGVTLDKLRAAAKVERLAMMPAEDFDGAKDWLNKRARKTA